MDSHQTQPHIRAMTKEDIPQVMAIERDVYPTPWSEKIMRDCIRVKFPSWVLELNKKVIGYMIYNYNNKECHLLNLCIHRDYRRKGYGELFLEHCIKEATLFRRYWITLEVRPTNDAGIRLYEKFGFKQIGTKVGYYQDKNTVEDALVFARKL